MEGLAPTCELAITPALNLFQGLLRLRDYVMT
jgi:hypothetical protein